jgi:hypothetical protein
MVHTVRLSAIAAKRSWICVASQQDAEVPDADDALDDADALTAGIESVALLDMGLEIAEVPPRLDLDARLPGEPGGRQRVAERDPVAAAAAVDLGLVEHAGERAAAEHVAVMAFLVGPGDRLDAEPGEVGIAAKGARHLQRVDHPERAIEPAAFRLGLAVRADQQAAGRVGRAAKDIADAVDHRFEARLGELPGEPVARGDIGFGIGRAVDPGLVAAEFGEALQIGDDPVSIDLQHGLFPWEQTCQRIHLRRWEAAAT